jgi:hypothetical protein
MDKAFCIVIVLIGVGVSMATRCIACNAKGHRRGGHQFTTINEILKPIQETQKIDYLIFTP